MSDPNTEMPWLSDEDVERIHRGIAEMDRRRRENDYRPPPRNPAKLSSMAPGMVAEERRTTPSPRSRPDAGSDAD
jgi:hypothetical protein